MPHYIATPPNPLCTRALLERFATLATLSVDLSGFDALIEIWRAEVDEAIEGNDEIRSYIRDLEERIDAEPWGAGDEEDVPDADELVGEVEQFLRNQGDEQGDEQE